MYSYLFANFSAITKGVERVNSNLRRRTANLNVLPHIAGSGINTAVRRISGKSRVLASRPVTPGLAADHLRVPARSHAERRLFAYRFNDDSPFLFAHIDNLVEIKLPALMTAAPESGSPGALAHQFRGRDMAGRDPAAVGACSKEAVCFG